MKWLAGNEYFVMLNPPLRVKHLIFNIYRFFVPPANGGGLRMTYN